MKSAILRVSNDEMVRLLHLPSCAKIRWIDNANVESFDIAIEGAGVEIEPNVTGIVLELIEQDGTINWGHR